MLTKYISRIRKFVSDTDAYKMDAAMRPKRRLLCKNVFYGFCQIGQILPCGSGNLNSLSFFYEFSILADIS